MEITQIYFRLHKISQLPIKKRNKKTGRKNVAIVDAVHSALKKFTDERGYKVNHFVETAVLEKIAKEKSA